MGKASKETRESVTKGAHHSRGVPPLDESEKLRTVAECNSPVSIT